VKQNWPGAVVEDDRHQRIVGSAQTAAGSSFAGVSRSVSHPGRVS
jgi:hypothetical protein